jgi:hypothetical protein
MLDDTRCPLLYFIIAVMTSRFDLMPRGDGQ